MKLTLKEEERQEVYDLFISADAYDESILYLSKQAKLRREAVWNRVHEITGWSKEDYVLAINVRTGEVRVESEKEKDPTP